MDLVDYYVAGIGAGLVGLDGPDVEEWHVVW